MRDLDSKYRKAMDVALDIINTQETSVTQQQLEDYRTDELYDFVEAWGYTYSYDRWIIED